MPVSKTRRFAVASSQSNLRESEPGWRSYGNPWIGETYPTEQRSYDSTAELHYEFCILQWKHCVLKWWETE